MKDLRCAMGWHNYVPLSPDHKQSTYDIPGVPLECSRCKKSKLLHLDPADARHHSQSRDHTGDHP